jgi:hypothetical protein
MNFRFSDELDANEIQAFIQKASSELLIDYQACPSINIQNV